MMEYAKQANMPLAIEPLHPAYAADRACVNTTKQALDICDQLDPQRHPAGCLPHRLHAAGDCGRSEPSHAGQDEGSRSTYPTPRRVWISRGPLLSTLRSSTDT